MKWPKNHSFRKDVTSWHDSDGFCLVISFLSALVFYFSIEGIGVALEHDSYTRHAWMPILLMFLSGVVLVTNLFRILRRIVQRPSENE